MSYLRGKAALQQLKYAVVSERERARSKQGKLKTKAIENNASFSL